MIREITAAGRDSAVNETLPQLLTNSSFIPKVYLWETGTRSPFYMNLQVVTFQRSECMFPCPVMEVHVSGGLCHVYLTSATDCASVYFTIQYCIAWGVPGGSAARSHLQCRRPWSNSWVGKFPWRRAWPPTLSSCLEIPHGQRSMAGFSP